jgi:hypothetical protein
LFRKEIKIGEKVCFNSNTRIYAIYRIQNKKIHKWPTWHSGCLLNFYQEVTSLILADDNFLIFFEHLKFSFKKGIYDKKKRAFTKKVKKLSAFLKKIK